ncbi:FimV/HubP family polar landmark protein [Ramlibacter humi]|uniref:FimV/HubP family polar landmark protein n=1 Tax=Ramlibacter humi TaxID=2530451 RepID=UPI003084341E
MLSLPSTPAQALALGRVTVLSALGEPLRAEVDLPEITADEVASLRANVAAPDAFRAAGMEYSSALQSVNITLQRRGDGRYFLRLASDRPVTDPFVDLILETNWSSGRIVRDFTMLFDPPAMRQPQQPLQAQASPSTSPTPSSSVTGTPVPPRGQRGGAAPRAGAPATAAAPAAPRAAAPSPAPAPAGDGKQVTVQAGDTAGKIAAANKPEAISLDQMLVALLRSNPDAFAGGNVNRLRAGAVLNVPTAEQASAVTPSEATQTLVAQSRDFNEFRRRLAEGGVPTAPASGTGRESRGQVQAQVEDKRPTASAQDKLQLSKGAVQGKSNADQVASAREKQDANTRVAELNRNLSELNKINGSLPAGSASAPKAGASAPAAAATTAARPASTPAISVPVAAAAAPASTPAATAASRPAVVAAASTPVAAAPASAPAVAAAQAPASAPAAASAASTPVAAAASVPSAGASAPSAGASAPAPIAAATASAPAKPKRPSVPPPPPPEPSLVDQLVDNPIIPAAAGGVLALLVGLGIWKVRQRRKATQVDSSFLESRLQPDSFFGASGGQRVDTADAAPTGSSMVYSPSQLDAAGDVDPVAEADVYLAYGRDLQAEEILKEALRINPSRVAIHTKLLEIYAKRRDTKGFEQLASEAYSLTHGEGPEWAHICELGLELDPSNPMYQPGGQPSAGSAAPAAVAAGGAMAAAMATQPVRSHSPEPASVDDASDVDLDLDFSIGDDEPGAAHAPAAASMDPDATLLPGSLAAMQDPNATLAFPAAASAPSASLDMDFNPGKASAGEPEPVRLDAPDLTLNENSLNFSTEPIQLDSPPPAPAPAPAAAADGMLEFDLGGLSLDLPGSAAPAPAAAAAETGDSGMSTAGLELGSGDGEDPLATKLALAQEFNAIGDADGARSLAQEVIAEASGALKSKAQKFLAEIG